MPDSLSAPSVPEGLSFSPVVTARLDDVAEWCRDRGQRLTETRRQILGLILSHDRPSGAYDLLGRLRPVHPNVAPPTVYRALDFLLEHGLIHRLERLSAFVACSHAVVCHHGCDHGEWGVHRAQFLICRECGRAWELEQETVAPALMTAARKVGFRAEAATVEIEGLCAACQKDGSIAAPTAGHG
ncbi:Fur family transcriptional regulator [Gluconobacter morbifer]|uniref:FUR family transcriptional regulator n=1 Tax=Gluconobacter morbifer G707 TaxID=1088869 RepID=G6XJV1_9PROT|nr:Fur family transcriptional regulator [Gluconobacter morbifer]EHH67913.1 FUR family transcriptional regulator [Gluconobacter morbifer G707]